MPRILLVDDDDGQLAIREMLLQMLGHEVRTATTPQAALSLASAWLPHVVVMDLRLPTAADGRNLIERLPSTSRIIVLTGDATARHGNLPVFRVLKKPCPPRVLTGAIAEAAARHGTPR
jgi:CheY-like chemotaxis protein